ncbi:MAG: GNAT family N-acetyltransferase [Chloroflexi bacterium]|nr:GNAT family N-acetyltransferase [Chloroflexota bacterium]
MELVPAPTFSVEELTDAYNQTRMDYLVPMPMNVARFQEYIRVYDINMACSRVVYDQEMDLMFGLGMLGVRPGRAWITRLGVLPYGRRLGTGTLIMEGLIAQAETQDIDTIWLEVIKGNTPAHKMFRKFGFHKTRELIVARRPPAPKFNQKALDRIKRVTPLNHEDALILLSHRKAKPNWLNETETFQNVRNLSALLVELHDGGRGWVTYHAGLLQLTRIIVEVTVGDEADVTESVLSIMHQRHKRQDAIAENFCEDVVWDGFQRVGYFDSFRRLEMKKEM